MATLAERLLAELASGPADDDELATTFGVARQAVNQAARRLESSGRLARSVGPDGKIVNRLPDHPAPPRPLLAVDEHLSEDEVKTAIEAHLRDDGWDVNVAWGRARGIDIDAHRGSERLILEAKGAVALQPQQVNYFLGALGELLQRMDDPTATYGLALPDNSQYRGLVARLPAIAKERLGLVVYWIVRDPSGNSTVEVER